MAWRRRPGRWRGSWKLPVRFRRCEIKGRRGGGGKKRVFSTTKETGWGCSLGRVSKLSLGSIGLEFPSFG
jgi:hypothetical protein